MSSIPAPFGVDETGNDPSRTMAPGSSRTAKTRGSPQRCVTTACQDTPFCVGVAGRSTRRREPSVGDVFEAGPAAMATDTDDKVRSNDPAASNSALAEVPPAEVPPEPEAPPSYCPDAPAPPDEAGGEGLAPKGDESATESTLQAAERATEAKRGRRVQGLDMRFQS
jgi:hypothetical protein